MTLPATAAKFDSEDMHYFAGELSKLVNDPNYDTSSTYTTDVEHYPDHRLPFKDKHISYAQNHPNLDLRHYLGNLRISTRKR